MDAAEGWHWHVGEPLALKTSSDGRIAETVRHCWQAAVSLGRWTLVSCTVSPAFAFAGFELAPPGWQPAADEESRR